jgi:hypothetical protein
MLNRYRSPYRNYIHQLFVTPSKHLYVLKDGRLKWQDKAMDVALDRIEASDREHLVHYIVADHASSAFYAEVLTNKTLIAPEEFLTRAWSSKPDFFFEGIPEYLVVPTVVLKKHPTTAQFLAQLDVEDVAPSSGFYAGVHQVRNWEKEIANTIGFHNFREASPCTLAALSQYITRMLDHANGREINRPGIRMTRKELWEQPTAGRPELRKI